MFWLLLQIVGSIALEVKNYDTFYNYFLTEIEWKILRKTNDQTHDQTQFIDPTDSEEETKFREVIMTPFFYKEPNFCTKFDPLNYFSVRRSSYRLKA